MTVARTSGAVVVGVEGHVVEVEADVAQGLPGMTIVGLPDTAVAESRDRARAAVVNSGGSWPARRVTVGLSPASLHKRGSGLDLAVAVAVLAATDQIPARPAAEHVMVGELGLDGRVRPVRGVVVAAMAVRAEALRGGRRRLVVPVDNAAEAALVPDVEVVAIRSLAHLRRVLREEDEGASVPPARPAPDDGGVAPDLADVRGQHAARQALEIAAAGGHHLALLGPPGVGKTLLAERLPGLLPDLEDDEALEVTAIRSIAGRLPAGVGLVRRPPFEAPHHTASPSAVIGGGAGGTPRVGLVSLAHRGVLFMDEAPEFSRPVLEALRQPLESGEVTVSRSGFSVRFPARFQLVLASNPCPCGNLVGRGDDCRCSAVDRRRYATRLSGPLLDRVDLRLTLDRPPAVDVLAAGDAEPTAAVAVRVAAARARARHRWQGTPWRLNAEVPGAVLRRDHPPAADGLRLLERSAAGLSARAVDRLLRVSWTLADLAGRPRPARDEIAQAVALRTVAPGWAA